MRHHATAMAAVAAAACSVLTTTANAAAVMAARPAVLGGTWSTAIEVPGTGALNQGGSAAVNAVSCASAGDCSAGGAYRDGSGHFQAFVAGEVSGTWGTAIEVPGTAGLNQGGGARVTSVSCASAGDCSAGGFYTSASGDQKAFVVSETHGTWGAAEEVPGTGAANQGNAQTTSLSCTSAGDCSAGGFYPTPKREAAFAVGERNGTWGRAIEVPGTARLNGGDEAEIASVSCASAGNCSAAGHYLDSNDFFHAFVVSERNSTWGTAI